MLHHRHHRAGGYGCRLVALTLLLAITAIGQEVPARPAAPTTSEPAVQKESTSSAEPKETKEPKERKEPKVHFADLRWTASPTKGVVGYFVYRAVAGTSAKAQRITAVPVKGTRYRDTRVKAGTTYIYSLSAVQRINSQWVESKRTPLVTARIPSP